MSVICRMPFWSLLAVPNFMVHNSFHYTLPEVRETMKKQYTCSILIKECTSMVPEFLSQPGANDCEPNASDIRPRPVSRAQSLLFVLNSFAYRSGSLYGVAPWLCKSTTNKYCHMMTFNEPPTNYPAGNSGWKIRRITSCPRFEVAVWGLLIYTLGDFLQALMCFRDLVIADKVSKMDNE